MKNIRKIKSMAFLILIIGTLLLVGCNAQQKLQETPLLESIRYDASRGTVTSSVDKYAFIPNGETVTLTAKAHEGYAFAGWTKGAPIESYGEIVSENPEITFIQDSSNRYYANFIKESEVFVRYYANGGTINHAEAKNNCLIQKIDVSKHPYPTTIAQNGTFVRDGYVLKEYSSQAEGAGTITNIGQRVFSDAKIINLYAQWSPETNANYLTFSEQNDGVYVTGYTGTDEVLTIPAKHNGKNVVGIMQDAICSEKIRMLVLPETIKVIEEAAFNGCTSLQTVYLYDTVVEMTDKSFSGCPVETVCLNSVYDLKYYAVGTGKLELLFSQKDSEQNRLVVLSGSSGIYGLDAQLLEQSLIKDICVVNFGLQISVPGSFSMLMMKEYLHDGDSVLYAPECEFKQFGNTLTTNVFTIFDGSYTTMRNVDISKYTSFFSSLSMYSLAKIDNPNLKSHTNQFYGINGDSANSHTSEPVPPTYNFRAPTAQEKMTAEVYKEFNDVIHLVQEKGIKVYLSFAPFCTEACATEVTAEMLDAYSETLADNLDVVCISTQSAHDYPVKYFFEMFHMTAEGRKLRTEQLSKELNAQFAEEN